MSEPKGLQNTSAIELPGPEVGVVAVVIGGANRQVQGHFKDGRFHADALGLAFPLDRVPRWRFRTQQELQAVKADVVAAVSELGEGRGAYSVTLSWQSAARDDGSREILFTEEFDDLRALDLTIEEVKGAAIRMVGVLEARERMANR